MEIDFSLEKYCKSLVDTARIRAADGLDPSWFPGLFTITPAASWSFLYRPLYCSPPFLSPVQWTNPIGIAPFSCHIISTFGALLNGHEILRK
jgi:hypothetical protein